MMWVRVRLGKECWAFVSAYRPGKERHEDEMIEFWNELASCVEVLSRRNYVIVLGDMNARVGDREVEGVMGKFGVPDMYGRTDMNESGEKMLNVCAERELVKGNTVLCSERKGFTSTHG